LPQAAVYLGIRSTSLKGLLACGVLAAVKLPGGRGRDLRRTLLDRADLDGLIDASKQA